MIIVLGAMLALAAGYLFGVERERDRQRTARRQTATAAAATASPDTLLSDREWERFVTAVYQAADEEAS